MEPDTENPRPRVSVPYVDIRLSGQDATDLQHILGALTPLDFKARLVNREVIRITTDGRAYDAAGRVFNALRDWYASGSGPADVMSPSNINTDPDE